VIHIKSPTRIDLAGGTLDMWPLFAFLRKSHTINIAINIWTEVTLLPSEQRRPEIHLHSLDLNQSKTYQDLNHLIEDQDKSWSLIKEVILFFNPKGGFTLTTKSGSPVGGGLGGSSSLLISLIKAFTTWLKPDVNYSIHDWVTIAHNIEARVLTTPTGTQDYYPAFTGGLNCITYDDTGVNVKTYPLSHFQFSASYFLVDTGKAHHSGLNNFDVLTRAVRRESSVLKALKNIQSTAQWLANAIELNPESIPWLEIFEREYLARIELSSTFSSPEIELLRATVKKSGLAVGIKILGAGGGGCVLVWVQDSKSSHQIQNLISNQGYRIIPIEFVDVI